MFGKIVKGILVSFVICIVPAFGTLDALTYPNLWILFGIGILSSVLQPSYRLSGTKSADHDSGTERQIIWSVFATQLMVILEAVYVGYPGSLQWNTASTVVLSVILLGLVLRTWAVFTLGSLFTMHLAVHKKHAVIQSGPYRFIRHPSYVGALFTYGATPFFLRAWYSLVPTLFILSIAWLRRIHHEEAMLREALGDAYETYCSRVSKVIPGIW